MKYLRFLALGFAMAAFISCGQNNSGNQTNNNPLPPPAQPESTPAPAASPVTSHWHHIAFDGVTDMISPGRCNPSKFTVYHTGRYSYQCPNDSSMNQTGSITVAELNDLDQRTHQYTTASNLNNRQCEQGGAVTEFHYHLTFDTGRDYVIFSTDLDESRLCTRGNKEFLNKVLDVMSQLENKYPPPP